jgi:hypothetical protein
MLFHHCQRSCWGYLEYSNTEENQGFQFSVDNGFLVAKNQKIFIFCMSWM